MNTINEAIEMARPIKPHWTSDAELAYLASLASASNIIIEIGSWHGRSAKVMANVTPGILYCVDIWNDGDSGEVFQKNMAEELKSGKVVSFKGDSAAAAPFVLEALNGKLADFVWVDDGHLYTDVVRDITHYLPMLKPGGLMVGHDYYVNDPVAKAVEDTLPGFDIAVGTIWRWHKPEADVPPSHL